MEQEQNILAGLAAITLAVLLLNMIMMGQAVAMAGETAENTSHLLPTGVPKLYGAELGISFDGVSPNDPATADLTIRTLAQKDMSITLEGADKERYINVLYKIHNGISCEYCCGARAVIFENGEPACGCAHSFAMRGLAKYLITEHADEFTDEEILAEVGKWKALFFPTQMELKAGILREQGIEVDYINLASNRYRGIEQGKTAGGMVGGC